MKNIQNQNSWNAISRSYQKEKRISLSDVHYGPAAPGEKELGLLGDVRGKKILELGCGGGQNSIVLAKWGAEVKGLDISNVQLEHAKKLAEKEGVQVEFIQGKMEELDGLAGNSFDIVISSHAIGYADDLKSVFSETARVLKTKGFLVFCFGHPMWLTIGTALEDNDLKEIRSYFDRNRDTWDWHCIDGIKATFNQGNWTLTEIINGLGVEGLQITRIEEPQAYAAAEIETKAPYSSHAIHLDREKYLNFVRVIRTIPFSLIVKARKI
ncbi:MAG: class I SAM-dependent methyltransferase [Candidatus Odinarchaeota archaeon]